MPANVAHMLIAYKALNRILQENIVEYSDLVNQFLKKQYKPFVNLGSLGPDLFYYRAIAASAWEVMTEGAVKAKGVEPWAYLLHSVRPNEYPLNLTRIVFKDMKGYKPKEYAEGEIDPIVARLAFIAGYLSHIAADQIIHPVVNDIVGPYYNDGDIRKDHRTCEVYQDIFLFNDVYRYEGKEGSTYDFFKMKFNEWADIKTDALFQNTEDWFRFFIQRGFAETYSNFMDEGLVEDSVDNLLTVLRAATKVGPYKDANKEYDDFVKNHIESDNYVKYVKTPQYLWSYRKAVELSAVYIIGFCEACDLLFNNMDFSDGPKNRFLSIVSSADLSAPLETDILDKAIAALQGLDAARALRPVMTAAVGRFQPLSSAQIEAMHEPGAAVRLKMGITPS